MLQKPVVRLEARSEKGFSYLALVFVVFSCPNSCPNNSKDNNNIIIILTVIITILIYNIYNRIKIDALMQIILWCFIVNQLHFYEGKIAETIGETPLLEERLTAECSHPCKDSQQRTAFHVVLSIKLHIAASCCNIVADL